MVHARHSAVAVKCNSVLISQPPEMSLVSAIADTFYHITTTCNKTSDFSSN